MSEPSPGCRELVSYRCIYIYVYIYMYIALSSFTILNTTDFVCTLWSSLHESLSHRNKSSVFLTF